MCCNSKPEYQTATQTDEPWSGQQGYLTDVFQRASNLARNVSDPQALVPQQYYPGNTVVPYAPETETALSMQKDRALSGSPTQAAANQNLTATLNGDFLKSGNPYMDALYESASRPIMQNFTNTVLPGIQSQFAAHGRLGSGMQANAVDQATQNLGRTLGDLSAQLYGGNYEAERGRQMTAAGMAPTIAAADYNDMERLANVGAARESLAGQVLQEDIDRFNFEQQAPWDQLGRYASMISGNYGGTRETAQPYYQNRGANLLGGAAATAGILTDINKAGGFSKLFEGLF